MINQGLFNAQEGVIINEEALINDPEYGENHPLRRPEAVRQANVRQHFNQQRLDGTWITAEFLMGTIIFRHHLMVKYTRLISGFAHISRRQIQVVNSQSGRIQVFNGAGHEQNVRREPLIIGHGHNHYTVSKSFLHGLTSSCSVFG